MLYRENEGVFKLWKGERINGILYPLMIENSWSIEELASINLYSPIVDEVPEGKVVVGSTVERVDGVVKCVYTLEDYVEPTPTRVSRRQAKLALLQANLLHLVEPALNALPEPQKTVTLIEWQDAQEFNRKHDLIESLAIVLGLTEQQVDDLFMTASKL